MAGLFSDDGMMERLGLPTSFNSSKEVEKQKKKRKNKRRNKRKIMKTGNYRNGSQKYTFLSYIYDLRSQRKNLIITTPESAFNLNDVRKGIHSDVNENNENLIKLLYSELIRQTDFADTLHQTLLTSRKRIKRETTEILKIKKLIALRAENPSNEYPNFHKENEEKKLERIKVFEKTLEKIGNEENIDEGIKIDIFPSEKVENEDEIKNNELILEETVEKGIKNQKIDENCQKDGNFDRNFDGNFDRNSDRNGNLSSKDWKNERFWEFAKEDVESENFKTLKIENKEELNQNQPILEETFEKGIKNQKIDENCQKDQKDPNSDENFIDFKFEQSEKSLNDQKNALFDKISREFWKEEEIGNGIKDNKLILTKTVEKETNQKIDQNVENVQNVQNVQNSDENLIDFKFENVEDEAEKEFERRKMEVGGEKQFETIRKYYNQRYNLFSKFDEGIQMDLESWFSVTPEVLAAHTAERMACNILVEGFCGAGGNTIQFAKTCDIVYAIDIDPKRLQIAKNNAKVYGVKNIEFILGDYFKVIPLLFCDCVFASPPWGGPDYIKTAEFDISNMCGMSGFKMIEFAAKQTKNIALFLPRNLGHHQILNATRNFHLNICEIEKSIFQGNQKASTVYFGDLTNFF